MPPDLLHEFWVGPWKIEPLRGAVTDPDGKAQHLEPKVMDVFVCLAEHANELVTRDQLLETVWSGHAAADELLTRAISDLRHALQDDRGDPKYIETVPKRGYRLIGQVRLPKGIRLEQNIAPEKSKYTVTGRRLVIAVILLLCTAVILFAYDKWWMPEPLERSIAVLPFRNLSAVAEDAYFVDGIHDDILTQLAKLSSFGKVISRTSMEQYRETSKPMPQIGQELGVATILEGGVQRAGDRVRINVQLIEAATDEHLWVESYDRQLTVENVFLVQGQIARDVATALTVTLTPQEDQRLTKIPTTSLAAYRLYHLGRQESYKRTAESLERSAEYLEEAIRADPDYAQAYAGLAETYFLYGAYRDLSREDAGRKARPLAERAIQLDPTLAEGYAALGSVNTEDGQWAAAESNFDTAIALNPGLAWARMDYGVLLRWYLGRPDEAIIQLEEAARLSPLEPLVHTYLGEAYAAAHRVQDALETLHYALEIGPDNPRTYEALGDTYRSFLGRQDEAVKWYAKGLMRDPDSARLRYMITQAYMDMGDIPTARLMTEQIINLGGQSEWSQSIQGIMLMYLRQYQEALEFAEHEWQQSPTQVIASVLFVLYSWNGEYRRALEFLDKWLALAEDIPHPETKVTGANIGVAIGLVQTLAAMGENARAQRLLNNCLEVAKTAPQTGFYIGVKFHLVAIYALLDDTPNALLALREVIDAGVLGGWWWILLQYPATEPLRNEPQFQEMVEEIRTEMAAQLENVREMQRTGEMPPLPVVNH
jgi:TolB-like protein/DNA-binding winged helix-turn-helix (wHTH) protein/predicted Zn-dependent protease